MANRIKFDEIPPFLEKNCVVTSAVQEVLKNFRENYQKFGKVADQDLLALSSVFGETLEKALEIVEGNKVTYFHTSSDIVGIFKVEGSSSKTYTIFPSVNYCPCLSYKYKVPQGSQILCKHVLATVIADVIGKKQPIEITNEHLNDLLLSSVSLKYYKVANMNDREDWHNRNPYMEQFMCPVSGIPPAFGVNPNNWVHVPPQTMPWGVPAGSQPPVVRFTAGDFNTHSVPVKRKIDSSMEFPPAKMLVTEEKMAAHLRGLHISDVDPPDASLNIACKEEPMETERLPRLVISDELKNLKTESIIPESILKKLEKPEMALVLWQPPATDLDSKLRELKKLSLKKEKDKDKDKELKEGDMDVTIEAEMENKTVDNVFRPIDPVPMPTVQNQFLQPVPQFHGFTPFSQNPGNNFPTKFS